MKITKTNAARILDSHHIAYELIPYQVDESNLGATHIAEQLHEDIAQVFKTLVLRGTNTGIFVCVIPGDQEVNLKQAATITGNKSCQMVLMKELLSLTGYIRGGCTPIGMKKPYPVYIHQSVNNHPFVYISGGQRGLQIKLSPHDLIQVTQATLADLIVH